MRIKLISYQAVVPLHFLHSFSILYFCWPCPPLLLLWQRHIVGDVRLTPMAHPQSPLVKFRRDVPLSVLPKHFLGMDYAGWFAITFLAVRQGMNLSFVKGAGDSSPTLHKGHRRIFIVHKRMLADGTLSLTSIWGMPLTVILLSYLWNTRMTVYSWADVEPKLDSAEMSVRTSRLSCQPVDEI